jgi:ribosome-binding protein aMBF1 (putative translation factor)
MTATLKKTATASAILRKTPAFQKPAMKRLLAEESANAQVAMLLHDAREAAGLTQRELAARVGTSRSVITRLEDADYRGHSLAMLRRIADALDLELTLELTPRRSNGTGQK